MNEPRPESRIRFLEKQFNTIGANVEELAEDLKQDIRQLNDDTMTSFKHIGEAFTLLDHNTEIVKQDVAAIKATMATKEDLTALEDRIKDDITTLRTAQDARFDKLEATQAEILTLLKQQRPDT